MKKTFVKSLVLAFAGSLLAAGSALAISLPSITGGVSLTGSFKPVDIDGNLTTLLLATGIDFGGYYNTFPTDNTVFVTSGTGSFDGLAGTVGEINNFQFASAIAPGTPLWSAGIFSFDLDSLVVTKHTADSLDIAGVGTLHGDGYADTAGRWVFGGQEVNANFSWSSSNGADAAPVPEPATMLLLGTGLTGLAAARRRRANKNVN